MERKFCNVFDVNKRNGNIRELAGIWIEGTGTNKNGNKRNKLKKRGEIKATEGKRKGIDETKWGVWKVGYRKRTKEKDEKRVTNRKKKIVMSKKWKKTPNRKKEKKGNERNRKKYPTEKGRTRTREKKGKTHSQNKRKEKGGGESSQHKQIQ